MSGCFSFLRLNRSQALQIDAPAGGVSQQYVQEASPQTSNSGPEWLPVDVSRLVCTSLIGLFHIFVKLSEIPRHTRARKAIAVMESNVEGLMWVKLVEFQGHSPSTASAHPEHKSPTLVPIRWTVRQQLSCPEAEELSCYAISEGSENSFTESPRSGYMAPMSHANAGVDCGEQGDNSDECDNLCIVCMARTANFQLLPCRHDRFCRQCIVETICTWVRPEAPSCPLCRGTFHTMVLLDGDDKKSPESATLTASAAPV